MCWRERERWSFQPEGGGGPSFSFSSSFFIPVELRCVIYSDCFVMLVLTEWFALPCSSLYRYVGKENEVGVVLFPSSTFVCFRMVQVSEIPPH